MKSIDKVEGTFDSRNRDKRGRPSQATIRRLPRYHRYLANLLSEGILRISSSALAERMHVTASQIRQDLSCFGDFGQQGYGYNVKYLYHKIGLLLGAEAGYRAVLVGVGNMGQALLRSRMFERRGVRCVAAFDRDPTLVGRIIGDVTVLDGDTLEAFCREERVDLAILTLPADAETTCDPASAQIPSYPQCPATQKWTVTKERSVYHAFSNLQTDRGGTDSNPKHHLIKFFSGRKRDASTLS